MPNLVATTTPVAPALDRLADEDLVGVRAVDVGGVEERDPEIERAVDRRDAFGLVGRAVELGHAHAAEAEGGHGERAEMTRVHVIQGIQVNGPRGIRAASNAGSASCSMARPSIVDAGGVTPSQGSTTRHTSAADQPSSRRSPTAAA